MLAVSIHNNDVLVGYIYCVNEKTINPPGDDRFHPVPSVTSKWYAYNYEYYRPGEGVIKGTVQHYRPNGAAALLKEICEDIETKGGK